MFPHMSIANAPSLARRAQEFARNQVACKIPSLRASYENKRVYEVYRLARIASNRDFPAKALDSGWANHDDVIQNSYKKLTNELVEISKAVGSFVSNIPQPLHWSRLYEYPYAIINSSLPEHPSREFRIFDPGASNCPLQFYFAMKGYEVYSLDLDLWALKRVAKTKSERGLKSLHIAYGNILSLPFPDNYFDRVVNISVLEHIVYRIKQDTDIILRAFVNELLRVLKPNGLIVLTFDVNMSQTKSDLRLFFEEYESLCKIMGILPTRPSPKQNLFIGYQRGIDDG